MIETLVLPDEDLKSKIKEIDFLNKCQNKNIVKYIGHFVEIKRPCIVTYFYKVLFYLLKTQHIFNKF